MIVFRNYYLLKYILLKVNYTFLLSFLYSIILFSSILSKIPPIKSKSQEYSEWMRIRFPGPFVCILCLYKITIVIPIRRVANALASGNSEFNYVYRASVGRPLGFSNKSDKDSRMDE